MRLAQMSMQQSCSPRAPTPFTPPPPKPTFSPLCVYMMTHSCVCRVLNAYAAAGTTSSALSAATVDLTTIQEALGTMGTIRLVVLAILIITAVFVLVLSALQAVRKRSGAGEAKVVAVVAMNNCLN